MQLAMVALLLRALVPAGFMAAPLADGWPLQLCPTGMAMSSYLVLLGAGEHADHLDHSAHSAHASHGADEPDPACGLGSAYSAVALALAVEPTAPEVIAERLPGMRTAIRPRAPPRAHRSRAPPHFS